MTKIKELIEDFKLNQEILGREKKYVDLCLFRLYRWEKFTVNVLRVTETEEVTQLHIKKYIQERQREGSEVNTTLNNNIATLKVFFQYLVNEEFIDEQENPMRRIRNLKEEKKVIVTFNDNEVSRIINDLKEETYSNVRDKLILIMLFDTGIRVSELCNIKNIDVARRHILIHGKGSKQRLVYISNIMRKYMRRYEAFKQERFRKRLLDEVEDYYFLDQSAIKLSRSRINKILKEHCNNAGVRKEVRCSPHDCRHYFAQKQLRNGIDIYSLSRLMGHFDTQITSKYLRGLEQDDILQIGRLHSPLNGIKIKQSSL
ncbi:MAG: tyrosine-type recombinase/integrase [Candidatus Pristimantibacillus lignocellulolyticus]|uniref:Tyrosine-type recombinase/integrase n=1 Tax=Candidatus Pristimantibacillus lignocellulolyticus TaxID=2994561 RepID=A0A9J6ZG29_9BACL|nr:MAG: tyrosine-type recombinase/integrase [Candidatus Pristimantibacillus lignocellulolyticus]